jgi:hypothetical protein
MKKRFQEPFLVAFLLLGAATARASAEDSAAGMAFFEKKIRPVLVEHCYKCHSTQAGKKKGGLLLDSREALRKGGESGPAVVPGDPDKSLIMQALRQELDLRMPPKGKLPEPIITAFAQWVKMGAPDPRQTGAITPRRSAFRIREQDRRHWAFQPVADVQPPSVQDEAWCASEIDRFILDRLETLGHEPGERADRAVLLRRVYYDLIGLPPTPEELQAFLADSSPDAFARVVDRLLASKEFGVRWGRHWLDGVRYASDVDKTGRYRDWVVRAFNEDLPYDTFVRLQIAGDLVSARGLPPSQVHPSGASLEGITATGMLALAVWEKVARDLAVAEIADSQIDVVGRQFLGLTLSCARCHDHKFDPISNEDYYALAGIFFSSHISPGNLIADGRLSDEVIGIPLLSQADAAKNAALDAQISPLQQEIQNLEKKAGPAARLHKVRQQLKALSKHLAKSKEKEKTQKEIDKLRAEEKKLLADRDKNGWDENPPELVRVAQLRKQIQGLEKRKITPPQTIGIQEGGVKGSNREGIGDAPIYLRGNYLREGKVVPRRLPVLFAGEDQVPLGKQTKGSGRLQLAEWIASADNPLTARVMVNRVWQHLFGEGLVRTPSNFGLLGEKPTHPELLDYLTRRFLTSGWSVKKLIRDIVLSSTYQQSSFASRRLLKADPENRLLGRMSRKRLEYEAIRDSLLFVSGQLALSGSEGKGLQPRTLYAPLLRKKADPARVIFDGPDPLAIVPKRAASTTTPQALFLMNNALVATTAERLAGLLLEDPSLKDDPARITRAYLKLLARPPSPEEIAIGQEYIQRASWAKYLQVLLCTNEFVYLD